MKGRFGIFGGLFDPIHLGHIHLAESLLTKAGLDGILLVPSASPPHKDKNQSVPFIHRAAMVKLAIESIAELKLCEIEAEQKLSGYALHTVQALKKRYPETKFSFIIGADNITDIFNWYQYDKLLSEINVIAGSRGGVSTANRKTSDERIKYYEVEPMNISSTEIRELFQNNQAEKTKKLLPEKVYEYAIRNGLYQ